MGWIRDILRGAKDDDPEVQIEQARALASRHSHEGLVCALSLGPSSSLRKGLSLSLRVTNPSEEARQFCSYHTPFEGIRNRWLEITGEGGDELPFQGKMAKRAPPDANDFLVLQPGESRSASFDPTSAFELVPGAYRIRFLGSGVSLLPDSESVTLVVEP